MSSGTPSFEWFGSLETTSARGVLERCRELLASARVELRSSTERARIEVIGGQVAGSPDLEPISQWKAGSFRVVQALPDFEGQLTERKENKGSLGERGVQDLLVWAGDHRLTATLDLYRGTERGHIELQAGKTTAVVVDGKADLAALARLRGWHQGEWRVALKPLFSEQTAPVDLIDDGYTPTPTPGPTLTPGKVDPPWLATPAPQTIRVMPPRRHAGPPAAPGLSTHTVGAPTMPAPGMAAVPPPAPPGSAAPSQQAASVAIGQAPTLAVPVVPREAEKESPAEAAPTQAESAPASGPVFTAPTTGGDLRPEPRFEDSQTSLRAAAARHPSREGPIVQDRTRAPRSASRGRYVGIGAGVAIGVALLAGGGAILVRLRKNESATVSAPGPQPPAAPKPIPAAPPPPSSHGATAKARPEHEHEHGPAQGPGAGTGMSRAAKRERAQHLIEKGRREMLEGKRKGAIAQLEEAQRLDPDNVSVRVYLAQARGQLGEGTLIVESVPKGARVTVDGLALGPTPVHLRVPAGDHTVQVGDQTEEVHVAAGKKKTVKLKAHGKARGRLLKHIK